MKFAPSIFALGLAAALAACASQQTTSPVEEAPMAQVDVLDAAVSLDEAGTYTLDWTTSEAGAEVDIFVSRSADGADSVLIGDDVAQTSLSWTPDDVERARRYFIIKPQSGEARIAAIRVLPLEQASNFRDIGGYTTEDGRMVKWGRAYRSGAMPLLTEADYAYIEGLDLDSVVDFRSLDEREVVADQVDDRTGAYFIANDYSMAVLMKGFQDSDGEHGYAKMEPLLRPQYRAMFRRLIADEGAVLYHCSAGQDRTGVATALIYDVLGVDRDTIVADYHLSTELRRTQWEMPDVDPEDYPGNLIVQYYVAARKSGEGPKPLYTPSGASQIVQFLDYVDAEFGGSEGYLKKALGLSDADISKLREALLD